MKRKVMELGANCLVISLPTKWARAHNVKKGDQIDIDEKAGRLVVLPKPKTGKKETTVNASSKTDSVIRLIILAPYNRGYDKIKIKYKTEKEANTIRELIETLLLGFDITEKKENIITIENVAEPSGEKQNTILRRIFLNILESFETLINDLESNELRSQKIIKQLTKNVHKYFNFCLRNISKQAILTSYSAGHINIYYNLLLSQFNLFYLYQNINKKIKISKDTIEMTKHLKDQFERNYKAFFNEDVKTFQAADATLKQYRENTNELLKKTSGDDTVTLHHLAEIARFTRLISRRCIILFSIIKEEN